MCARKDILDVKKINFWIFQASRKIWWWKNEIYAERLTLDLSISHTVTILIINRHLYPASNLQPQINSSHGYLLWGWAQSHNHLVSLSIFIKINIELLLTTIQKQIKNKTSTCLAEGKLSYDRYNHNA